MKISVPSSPVAREDYLQTAFPRLFVPFLLQLWFHITIFFAVWDYWNESYFWIPKYFQKDEFYAKFQFFYAVAAVEFLFCFGKIIIQFLMGIFRSGRNPDLEDCTQSAYCVFCIFNSDQPFVSGFQSPC